MLFRVGALQSYAYTFITDAPRGFRERMHVTFDSRFYVYRVPGKRGREGGKSVNPYIYVQTGRLLMGNRCEQRLYSRYTAITHPLETGQPVVTAPPPTKVIG